MPDPLSTQEELELIDLENALWQDETRFDPLFMSRVLAADFIEYGRSGRTYDREAILQLAQKGTLRMHPPRDLRLRTLAKDVVQITYVSEVSDGREVELAHRSSIWTRTDAGWELRFHQGTPFTEA